MSEGKDQFLEDVGMDGLPKDTKMTESMLISTVALNMAMKWHDIGVVKDGAMYQQLKLEGKNLPVLTLPDVLATAQAFEAHLLAGPNRHAEMLSERIIDNFVAIIGDLTMGAIDRALPKPKKSTKGKTPKDDGPTAA